tara:strand:- start:238 stop:408 length:171 start_codon:yes stop_codon:yes gene_type:complete
MRLGEIEKHIFLTTRVDKLFFCEVSVHASRRVADKKIDEKNRVTHGDLLFFVTAPD